MKLRILLALLAYIIVGCGPSKDLKGVSGQQLPVIDVGSKPLTEVTSPTATKTFAARAKDGALLVLYLGYTNCPDICPTTMSDMRTARQDLSSGDQKLVDFAFVTVDQNNDTAPVLLDYTHRYSFGPNDHSVRPTAEELTTVQKTLFATSAPGDKSPSGLQIVNHTAYTYVVNSQGLVVDEWPYGTPAKDMTHDLKTLLT